MSDQSHHFFQSLSRTGHLAPVISSCTEIKTYSCVAFLSPGDKATFVLWKWIIDKWWANKDENMAEKWKVIMLEVKFESDINGVMEEIVDHGNDNTASSVQDNLDMQPEKLIEGKHKWIK